MIRPYVSRQGPLLYPLSFWAAVEIFTYWITVLSGPVMTKSGDVNNNQMIIAAFFLKDLRCVDQVTFPLGFSFLMMKISSSLLSCSKFFGVLEWRVAAVEIICKLAFSIFPRFTISTCENVVYVKNLTLFHWPVLPPWTQLVPLYWVKLITLALDASNCSIGWFFLLT